MAKPKSKPPRNADEPAPVRVLPLGLRIGDRLTDETGVWEVIGRPFMTAGGKTANVRVKRVESAAEMIRVYGAHERVTVKRSGQ